VRLKRRSVVFRLLLAGSTWLTRAIGSARITSPIAVHENHSPRRKPRIIFNLGRPDVLPVHDLGVRRGFQIAYKKHNMPAPEQLAKHGIRRAPHRTLFVEPCLRRLESRFARSDWGGPLCSAFGSAERGGGQVALVERENRSLSMGADLGQRGLGAGEHCRAGIIIWRTC
jgi:hypothetical protein